MFKHYLSLNFKFFLKHIISQIICFMFAFLAFLSFLSEGWGKAVASVLFIGFYIISMYTCAYKFGEKDSKSYSEHKPYALKGFTFSVLLNLVNLILLLASLLSGQKVVSLVFEHFNHYLLYLLRLDTSFKAVSVALVFLIPALSAFVGYLAGYKRYELGYKIMEKLVYKK